MSPLNLLLRTTLFITYPPSVSITWSCSSNSCCRSVCYKPSFCSGGCLSFRDVMVGSGFVGPFCLQSMVWCWSVGLLMFKVCRGPLCGPWFFILPLADPAFSFLHFYFLTVFRALDFLNNAWRFRYRTGPKVSPFSQENRKREEDPSRIHVSWSISLHNSFSHVLLLGLYCTEGSIHSYSL